jgi:ribosome maturation factor RimP
VGHWPTFFCGERKNVRIEETLKEQLINMVQAEGLTLLATEVVGGGPSDVLRLVVDGEDGVNHDQCASISRQASALLDVEDLTQHAYSLEVSSPGLDRKLFSVDDYERYAGKQVTIRMKPSYRENRSVVGELVGIEDGILKVTLESGESVELPFGEVFETRLEIDWKLILKEGKNRQ